MYCHSSDPQQPDTANFCNQCRAQIASTSHVDQPLAHESMLTDSTSDEALTQSVQSVTPSAGNASIVDVGRRAPIWQSSISGGIFGLLAVGILVTSACSKPDDQSSVATVTQQEQPTPKLIMVGKGEDVLVRGTVTTSHGGASLQLLAPLTIDGAVSCGKLTQSNIVIWDGEESVSVPAGSSVTVSGEMICISGAYVLRGAKFRIAAQEAPPSKSQNDLVGVWKCRGFYADQNETDVEYFPDKTYILHSVMTDSETLLFGDYKIQGNRYFNTSKAYRTLRYMSGIVGGSTEWFGANKNDNMFYYTQEWSIVSRTDAQFVLQSIRWISWDGARTKDGGGRMTCNAVPGGAASLKQARATVPRGFE